MRGLLKGALYLFGGGLLVLALVIAAGFPSLRRAPLDGRESPITVAKGSRRGFAIDQSGRVCVTKDGTVPPMKNGMLAPDCPTLD